MLPQMSWHIFLDSHKVCDILQIFLHFKKLIEMSIECSVEQGSSLSSAVAIFTVAKIKINCSNTRVTPAYEHVVYCEWFPSVMNTVYGQCMNFII